MVVCRPFARDVTCTVPAGIVVRPVANARETFAPGATDAIVAFPNAVTMVTAAAVVPVFLAVTVSDTFPEIFLVVAVAVMEGATATVVVGRLTGATPATLAEMSIVPVAGSVRMCGSAALPPLSEETAAVLVPLSKTPGPTIVNETGRPGRARPWASNTSTLC